MAESDAVAEHSGKTFGFLAKKAGPLPIGVWLVAAVAIWWYMTKRNTSSTAAGQDPGIDPATGAPYSQELGAAEQQLSDQSGSGSGGTSGSTVAGQFQDNNGWAQAAINYLVARGIDPTQATEAIQSYLSGAPLTSSQQADVNLAIQGLGAPPSIPGPTGTAPGQVIVPPPSGGSGGHTSGGSGSGQVKQYPKPSGLKVTSTTPTTISVTWNNTNPPAKSFTVATYQLNGKRVGYSTVSVPDAKGGKGSYTVTGLHPKWSYKVQVWANGGKVAPPHAEVPATCK